MKNYFDVLRFHFAFLFTKCMYGFCVILAMNGGLKGTGKYYC